VLVAVAVGVAVALAAIAIGFSIIAIPLYALASTDPAHGVDRPFIRNGLLYVALPVGAALGIAAGSLVGVWYARGGRLPNE
jgi:hypothetical protein